MLKISLSTSISGGTATRRLLLACKVVAPRTPGKTYADIPVLAPEVTDEEFAEVLRLCRSMDRSWEPPEC